MGRWYLRAYGEPTVNTYDFLSNDWVAAAREIHDEFSDRVDASPEVVRINVVVTDVPFLDTPLLGSIDTSSGGLLPEWGHIDDPEATITVPYETARALFVTQDYEAVMLAFMQGVLDIEGDVTRILAMQDLNPSPEQLALGEEVAERLQAITR